MSKTTNPVEDNTGRSWLSLERAMIVGQYIVIILLGYWFIQEYNHNVYLREYTSSFWASNWWLAPAVLAGLAVAGAVAYLNNRGEMTDEADEEERMEKKVTVPKVGVAQKEMVTSSGVVVMDVCPFCNIPLRTVGEDRYHCRKCRRYFKK